MYVNLVAAPLIANGPATSRISSIISCKYHETLSSSSHLNYKP